MQTLYFICTASWRDVYMLIRTKNIYRSSNIVNKWYNNKYKKMKVDTDLKLNFLTLRLG